MLQRGAFYRAMGLLTVASPCALVMVPLAYVSAIAAIASRWGRWHVQGSSGKLCLQFYLLVGQACAALST